MLAQIKTMLELQRINDSILRADEEIKKCNQTIIYWQNEAKKSEVFLKECEANLLNARKFEKSGEIELGGYDDLSKKLEERKMQVSSDKEFSALLNEIDSVSAKKAHLEEELLKNLELLEELTEKYHTEELKHKEVVTNAKADIKTFKERIDRFNEQLTEYKNNFEKNTLDLDDAIRERFKKMLVQKNGKALVELKNGVCSGCNCKITYELQKNVESGDRLITCSNCGRYLYFNAIK